MEHSKKKEVIPPHKGVGLHIDQRSIIGYPITVAGRTPDAPEE